MLDVDDSIESLVFALQPLHAPEILQRGRNNAANGGEELNVFFIKTLFGAARIQVNQTDDRAKKNKRSHEQGPDAGRSHEVARLGVLTAASERQALTKNALNDARIDFKRLLRPPQSAPTGHGSDLFPACVGKQEDGATLGWDHIKDQIQQLAAKLFGIPD